MPGLAGRRARILVSGAPLDFTTEACTTADDRVYTIADPTRRFWDRNTAVQVFDDGSPVNPATDPYRINRLTGQVIFTLPDAGRGPVTVTGKYLPTTPAAGARSYAWTIESAMVDDTEFEDAGVDGHTRKLSGLLDVSGSIGRRFRVNGGMAATLLAGVPVILEFYADRSQPPNLVAWALLNKEQIQSAIDGSVDADIEWQGAPDADGTAIAVPA